MAARTLSSMHNKYAPYWAIAMIFLLAIGLLTINIELGAFWSGYVLDMAGPAWTYILFRGLFTARADNIWTRFFTPGRTFLILLAVCYGIETMQYFGIYTSTFDPWDLLAYTSIMLALFLIDSGIYSKDKE